MGCCQSTVPPLTNTELNTIEEKAIDESLLSVYTNANAQDHAETARLIEQFWDSWYIPGISDFVSIPNLTPMVDTTYRTNGLLEKAIDLVDQYVNKLEIKGVERKVFHPENSNPLIVYKVEPENLTEKTKNIMIYGHLDK